VRVAAAALLWNRDAPPG